MRIKGNILRYMSSLILPVMIVSCQREPIHEPFSSYFLKLEPDFTAKHIRPATPNIYDVIVFDKKTHKAITRNFIDMNGGYIYDLTPGVYEMLVYGYNLDAVKLEDIGYFNKITAVTGQSFGADTLSIEAPEHVMVARDTAFTIPLLYDRDDVHYLYAYPKTIMDTWCLEVSGIKGLGNAESINLYVGGQSRSKKLSDESFSVKDAAVHVAGAASGTSDVLHIPFCTFGRMPGKKCPILLVITDRNGHTFNCRADVTGQFDDIDNKDHWLYLHFDITLEPKKDGGFTPDVQEWGENVYEYDIY